jgi:hypothetical protein
VGRGVDAILPGAGLVMSRSPIAVVLLATLAMGATARADPADSVTERLKQGYYDLRGVRRFVYTDDRGREVMVERLSSVPGRFRDSARPLEPEGEIEPPREVGSVFSLDMLRLGDAKREQAIYRYVNSEGRTVYTNIAENLPADARDKSVVDLSDVSLHTELGNEIERQLMEEHRRLRGLPSCDALASAADEPFWRRVWADYAPLVVCAGVLLFLFALTPVALRRVEAPTWAKTLTFAVPLVAGAGLMAFTMTRTSRSLDDLQVRARPCQMATWGHVASKGEAYSLGGYAERLHRLRQELESAGVEADAVRGATPARTR